MFTDEAVRAAARASTDGGLGLELRSRLAGRRAAARARQREQARAHYDALTVSRVCKCGRTFQVLPVAPASACCRVCSDGIERAQQLTLTLGRTYDDER